MIFAPLLLTVSAISSDEIAMSKPLDRPAVAPAKQAPPTWADRHLRHYATPDQTDNVSIELDFLWWNVAQNSLEYAASKNYQTAGTGETAESGTGTMGVQGNIENASFGWEPGVRAALAYTFKGTPWFIAGDWTFLESASYQNLNAPAGTFAYLNGFNIGQQTQTRALSANSSLNFHYNLARLLLGTGWNIKKRLYFSLFVAPQASWIQERWLVNFIGTATSENYSKWRYQGYGMGVGTKTDFYLGRGFSVDLGGSVAGQYGAHDLHLLLNVFNGDGTLRTNLVTANANGNRRFLWTTQIATHLDWAFRTDRASTILSLGYEMNGLYNINEQYRVNILTTFNDNSKTALYSDEPIFLHGLVASLTIGF